MDARINQLLSVALLLVPCLAIAQREGTPDNTFGGQVLVSLHGVNQMEIAAGQLALTHSSSGAVKQFGADLVKDHSSADETVIALAAKRNVTLAPAKDDDGMKRLASLKDEAFDAVFLQMMVDGHVKTIALVQSAMKRVAEPQLATFLKMLLPTLETHRDRALALSRM
jgi:putative membrane protein